MRDRKPDRPDRPPAKQIRQGTMPDLYETPPYITCVCLADCHFWQTPPVARSVEKDWFGVMGGYLSQINKLARSDGTNEPLPVIIAGDLFDKYNPSYELFNLMMSHLPERTFSVYGQHDTEHHVNENIHKTAYQSLVEAKRIKHITRSGIGVEGGGGMPLGLKGFSWNQEIVPNKKPNGLMQEIAVCHSYIWTKTTGYVGADENKRLKKYLPKLGGYDVVVFGDNHTPFTFTPEPEDGPTIYNCGSFMRRKRDEMKHRPSVGLIMSDNTVKRHYLDVSQDKFSKLDNKTADKIDDVNTAGFIEELQQLGDTAADFSEAVKRFMDKYNKSDAVREMINELMPRKNK